MTFTVSYIILWLLVVFLTLAAIGLLGEVITLKRSLSGAPFRKESLLPIGSRAPKFSAVDIRLSNNLTSQIDISDKLILFISPNCSVCQRLANSLRYRLKEYQTALLAVCRGG